MDFVQFAERYGIGWSFPLPSFGDNDMLEMLIVRKRRTSDGIFGTLSLSWDPFTCFTVENLQKEIQPGTYVLIFDYSPHFNRTMPRLLVPDRDEQAGGDAGIRIHWANYPVQLEGCVAVGDKEEPDALDDSIVTFNRLYAILNLQAGINVCIRDETVSAGA